MCDHDQNNNHVNNANTKYFKLPFIGMFSTLIPKKLNIMLKRVCKPDIKIQLVFDSLKISSMFSTKYIIPFALQSFVVYKFICSGCNASYIGETCRHLTTRIKEHLVSDKNSHILKHLQSSPDCKSKCTINCFSILDKANSQFSLKIKEGIHIQLEKPTLNQQIKSFKLSILI